MMGWTMILFLPIGQHDAVVIRCQLQSRRVKQALTPYGGHKLISSVTEGDVWDPSWDGIHSVEAD